MSNRHVHAHRRACSLALAASLIAATIATGCGTENSTQDTTADAASSQSTTDTVTDAAQTTEDTEEDTMSETTAEAEIASANTQTVEIEGTLEYDSRYIDDYNVYVIGTYPSVTCNERNYATLKDGLDELSASIAENAKAQIDELETAARAAAAAGQIEEYDYGSYAYEQTMQLVRADSSVLSLLVTTYVNQGGAHPSISYKAYNYDPQAGMTFDLFEIIQDDQYDGLAGRIAEALANTYDHNLFNAYMELQMNAGKGAEVDNDAFVAALTEAIQGLIDDENLVYTIGQTGITFYFEANTLAAYAAGAQYVTFPYADVPELLWEGYTHAPASYITIIGNPDGTYITDGDGALHTIYQEIYYSQFPKEETTETDVHTDGKEVQ